MLGRVVEHVAALAQGGEVAWDVVPRIVIEMRAGEDDIGRADAAKREAIADRDPPAPLRAPASRFGVPPAPVAEMRDEAAMRPCTLFAARAGAAEPDRLR